MINGRRIWQKIRKKRIKINQIYIILRSYYQLEHSRWIIGLTNETKENNFTNTFNNAIMLKQRKRQIKISVTFYITTYTQHVIF